jgi:hypothetical protein
MAYHYRKRGARRWYGWLFWAFVCVCIFYGLIYALVTLVPPPGRYVPSAPAGERSACVELLQLKPPLDERGQVRLAACSFGMTRREVALVGYNFHDAVPADPRLGARTVRMIAVSPQGEVREVGETLLASGKAYRYVLIGRDAERLFLEIVVRGDGTRGYGYGSYK